MFFPDALDINPSMAVKRTWIIAEKLMNNLKMFPKAAFEQSYLMITCFTRPGDKMYELDEM